MGKISHKNFVADYFTRIERNDAIADYITRVFPSTKTILNLGGGGNKHLESSFAKQGFDVEIFEIDRKGDCDLRLDLDSVERLPFEAESFDLTCAFDVLEHLESFHNIAEEMMRIARQGVLISLPNPADCFTTIIRNKKLTRKKSGVYTKYYGLPLVKNPNRHRWWFTTEDIYRIFDYMRDEYQYTHVEYLTNKRHFSLYPLRLCARLLLGRRLYDSFFVPSVWIVLKRN